MKKKALEKKDKLKLRKNILMHAATTALHNTPEVKKKPNMV